MVMTVLLACGRQAGAAKNENRPDIGIFLTDDPKWLFRAIRLPPPTLGRELR